VPALPARLAAAAARARARGELGRGVALMTEAEASELGRRLYEGARRALRDVSVESDGKNDARAVAITFGGGDEEEEGGEGERGSRAGGEGEGGAAAAAAARRRRAAAAARRRKQQQQQQQQKRRSSSSAPADAELFSAASLQPLVGPRRGDGLATRAL